jgi:hypothetical protein
MSKHSVAALTEAISELANTPMKVLTRGNMLKVVDERNRELLGRGWMGYEEAKHRAEAILYFLQRTSNDGTVPRNDGETKESGAQ